MTSLTVTATGQVTLTRDLLQHLGIGPGEQVDIEKLPGGALRVRVARPTGTIDGLLHSLDGKVKRKEKLSLEDINRIAAAAVRSLMNAGNAMMNRPAVELGLAALEAGGDFADGAIAYEGAWLGGETVVSFDKQAVSLVSGHGEAARVLS